MKKINLIAMENKYYTPEIEDLRVGYECEWNTHADPIQVDGYTRWMPHTITVETLENYGLGCMRKNMKHFRTPYLTKEQMEAEGWNYSAVDDYYKSSKNSCGTYRIKQLSDNKLSIQFVPCTSLSREKSGNYEENRQQMVVECKSINELRTIQKLLNIK
jgi:hypothetical protein